LGIESQLSFDFGESKEPDELTKGIVNVASVPHRSPFRYPGGKTWLVPLVRRWLSSLPEKPTELIEPFAGGAIVGLSALFEQLVGRLVLVEIDEDVSAVWRVILNGKAELLAERIVSFVMEDNAVRDLLSQVPTDALDRAFVTILRNRVQRGGILAPGASLMKRGENGRGIRSRWYPATLSKRIVEIARRKEQISFYKGDGLQFIRENSHRHNVAFFIDPPYMLAGRRLYTHSEIDHEELFRISAGVKGDVLMTYDDTDCVRDLAQRYELSVQQVAMKNTHHAKKRELLIGHDLGWL
jgi:DNA adenine methylase